MREDDAAFFYFPYTQPSTPVTVVTPEPPMNQPPPCTDPCSCSSSGDGDTPPGGGGGGEQRAARVGASADKRSSTYFNGSSNPTMLNEEYTYKVQNNVKRVEKRVSAAGLSGTKFSVEETWLDTAPVPGQSTRKVSYISSEGNTLREESYEARRAIEEIIRIAAALALKKTDRCKDCKPCTPKIGTLMYRIDKEGHTHFCKSTKSCTDKGHTHYFIVQQTPYPECKCIAKELREYAVPGKHAQGSPYRKGISKKCPE